MIKFFSIIVQIIFLIIIVLFVVNKSFIVSFEIKDFIFSVQSSYIFISILVFLFLSFFIFNFYFKTKFSFFKYKNNSKLKKKEKGYNAFVSGMLAIANKDYKKAIIESKKISNYLDKNSSLSLLIKSEVYKHEKKYEELKIIYEEMSKDETTENLGYRGMMEQYLRAQDYHHAFLYGEKLFNKNPFIEKIYETLVNIIIKTNNWQQLAEISDKAYSNKIIDKKNYQENKSIAYYEIAKIKQYGDRKESLILIEKAMDLRKNFAPYVNLYIEILIHNKKYNDAKKVLKRAWSNSFHADLKNSIFGLAKHLETSFEDLAKYIVGPLLNNEESKILLVEAYIKSAKWQEARKQIEGLIDVQPKKEVCLLMAKIEEGDSNDLQKADSWILRSNTGIESNFWICAITNKSQEKWSSVSDSGYFNSLEWREPSMINTIKKIDNLN